MPGFEDLASEPRPGYGLDCLMCAAFARSSEYDTRKTVTARFRPCLPGKIP